MLCRRGRDLMTPLLNLIKQIRHRRYRVIHFAGLFYALNHTHHALIDLFNRQFRASLQLLDLVVYLLRRSISFGR